VVALVRDMMAPALVVVGAVILLLVTGVITAEQAFAGFSNPAPITVAALFIVGRAVQKTGAMQPMLRAALGPVRGLRAALVRLLPTVCGASSLLNNTPVVAVLAPQVATWAERRSFSPSSFLMPLSFATILGGTITLIGTSTNLVVSGLLVEEGLPAIGMFELARVGLPAALLGVAVLVLLSPLVLPGRQTVRQKFQEHTREYVMQAEVIRGGPLDGASVESGGLRQLQGVFLVEVRRNDDVISPATPETRLQGGDRLTFAGRVDRVRDLQAHRGLRPAAHQFTVDFNTADHTFYEAVVSAASPLAGSTLKDVDFRSRYQAAVLAIHRAGERVNEKLGGVRLREGDTLLLAADRDFGGTWRDRRDFLLVSHLGGSPPPSSRQALLVGAVALGIVAVAAAGLMPILHTALLGAMILVIARVLTPREAWESVDVEVVVLIAAAFGLGAAVQASGLAVLLGHGIVAPAAALGPTGVLVAVTLATILLTELITNNAAAVLVLDPRPFAIAVAIAASASFLTPIGYQTNTMVYGPGGYRFGDYARLGAPLTLIIVVSIAFLVPRFWPY
jgi:di/tricarboxylate transporter